MSDSTDAEAGNEELETPQVVVPPEESEEAAGPPRSARWLVFAAALLTLFSALNVWVERELLDTDEWVKVSSELLADETVRGRLAEYLVDQLYASVPIDEELEARLPENLDPLAGLVSAALRGPATDAVDRLLATERARASWSAVNRVSHETLVRILKDETRPGVSTADGRVSIELRELVVIVGQDIGLSEQTLERIPEDAGSITIVESDELATAQSVVRLIEILSVVLFLLVVALYGAALYLAPGARAEVLRWIGASLALVGGLILVGRRVSTRAVADAATDTEQSSEVALIVMSIGTRILRDMAVAGIAIGLLLLLFGWLLGESDRAAQVRSWMAPLFLKEPLVLWLTVSALFLIALYLLPGEPIRSWWRGAIFVVMFAIAVEALRRQIHGEHRSAESVAEPKDLADATSSP